jgi:hypothetical protein
MRCFVTAVGADRQRCWQAHGASGHGGKRASGQAGKRARGQGGRGAGCIHRSSHKHAPSVLALLCHLQYRLPSRISESSISSHNISLSLSRCYNSLYCNVRLRRHIRLCSVPYPYIAESGTHYIMYAVEFKARDIVMKYCKIPSVAFSVNTALRQQYMKVCNGCK